MAQILLGIDAARPYREQTNAMVDELIATGVQPCLAVVVVGENPSDAAYVSSAQKRMDASGIVMRVVELAVECSQSNLNNLLDELSSDDTVHGILLLRPLPADLSLDEAKNHVAAAKDVDGMCAQNIAGVFEGNQHVFAPCTAEACIEILEHAGITIDGKRAVIIGRSSVIGLPVAMMLMKRGATPTICHTHTRNLSALCLEADILVACAGRAKMVGATCVKPGAVVVDVGINFDEENKLVGDVDFDAVEPIAGAITPVPRGVGTMTTSVLARHVALACKNLTTPII